MTQDSNWNWYKGNIHTHTTNSDGDTAPEIVVDWYKAHQYDFLVLSDHNHRTMIDGYSDGELLLIPGEELSVRIFGGTIPIHIGGIGITRELEPIDAVGVVETLQANIDLVTSSGGIASLNHPNGHWAFDHNDIHQIKDATLLEVYNGWPGSNSNGGPGKSSGEQIWDHVLSAGQSIFGVAVDDAHHFIDFSHTKSNPGRGWIVVRATSLTEEKIIGALRSGEFYFSTGIELEDMSLTKENIELKILQHPYGTHSLPNDYIYNTKFIGLDGKLLSESSSLHPRYQIIGDEVYVRATITSSIGTRLWSQPVLIG
ncbi:hypothetical protein FIM02_00170 [SAR202 cluster bacterium AD-802-E10_MRT_200m]|nr:hypothetical protein [SAR202 cluster bacterium AD-802-E10_MRT_200m]